MKPRDVSKLGLNQANPGAENQMTRVIVSLSKPKLSVAILHTITL